MKVVLPSGPVIKFVALPTGLTGPVHTRSARFARRSIQALARKNMGSWLAMINKV